MHVSCECWSCSCLNGWRRLTSASLFKIKWNFFPASKRVFKSISVLLSLCSVIREPTISLNHIGVSSTSILVVLNWLTMKMRLLLRRVLPEMLLTRKETTRLELVSRLLHLVKSTIIIVDVSVSTGAVWLINDSAVAHHFDSVVVPWSRCCTSKSTGWHVDTAFCVRELLHIFYNC